jgi:hypothetical protein
MIMVMMPEIDRDVTDPQERVRLARWAISLRRAQAAGTGQITGQLAERTDSAGVRYCCLGIWCEIEAAGGRLERETKSLSSTQVVFRGPGDIWNSSTLPQAARLANSDNPDLLRFLNREGWSEDLEGDAAHHGYRDAQKLADEEAETACAADLNDDHGLNFGQIADVIAWRFQLTPEELAEAEAEPRVELVEGPAPLPHAEDGPGMVPF